MYNLLEIQSALKGLRPDEVMKYANGTNPQVPAYLALSELNRRKQLQDTASAFYGEPQSVKDQIASSLTKAPAGVNPAAAPAQVNPATVPPQLAVQQPPPTQAPAPQMAQVDPTIAPPQFARGGLSTLPVGMFKQSNYAGGGIVAFTGGGSAFSEDVQRAEDWLREQGRKGAAAVESGVSGIDSIVGDIRNYFTKPRPRDAESQEGGFYGKSGKDTGTPPAAPAAPVENPNKQASATSSGQLPVNTAIQRLSSKVTPEGKPLTDEQLFERRKALEKLAGVSADPYADIRARYAKIEEGRAKQAEGDPMDSLMYRLAALSQSKDIDFGVSMGESAMKTATFEKEQKALRDKQASDMAGLQKEIVKEDDARRRGDVKAVEEAQKNQKDIQLKMRKLDIDEQVARAQLLSFENRGSNAGLKENPLVTAAAKFFIENPYDPDVKKYKNDLEGYLNSRGLSSSGAAINRNASPTATPIVTTKAEFDKLPSGAIYTSTDGKQYRKP
jgi:hypothetical protein